MFNNYISIYNYFLKYMIFNTEKEEKSFTIRNENSTSHI